ncbi:hypothetical protein ACLKA7_012396 [Drosophila subpalustris]
MTVKYDSNGDYSTYNDEDNEYIGGGKPRKSVGIVEIEKVQTTGRIPSREQKYADIYREKSLRISQRVLEPILEHPKFNFMGKCDCQQDKKEPVLAQKRRGWNYSFAIKISYRILIVVSDPFMNFPIIVLLFQNSY